jgi:hypothetical protein
MTARSCTPHHAHCLALTEAAAAAALKLEAAADQQNNRLSSQRPTDKGGKHSSRGKQKKQLPPGEEARHISSSMASHQRLLEDTRGLLRKGVFVPVSWGHRTSVSLVLSCAQDVLEVCCERVVVAN